jgi:hypothetical protein
MTRDDDVTRGEIDWTTATVRDGRLNVEIAGEPGSEWADRVRAIAERLDRPGSAWGEITVKKAKLRVTDVEEGAEGDLRLLLEGAVMQANAEFAPDDDEDPDDEGSEQDRAMTAAFRGFAGPDDDDGGEADDGRTGAPDAGDAAS